ncbi:hypothetical protein IFM89_036130 [Coptis chinensis]|uniref:Uncharacterized protein n=1 Tax=Coptis chinensis TaxID=261450 RepID=A0A835LU53_9MAGN|nr:hypothetical protein IFM89_036130 [Coptis chinensis]
MAISADCACHQFHWSLKIVFRQVAHEKEGKLYVTFIQYVIGVARAYGPAMNSLLSEAQTQQPLLTSFEKWLITDQLLLSWLNATLTEDVLAEVVGISTSKEVWEKLETTFSQRSKARQYQLKQELQNCKQQKGESVSDFRRQFKKFFDSLAAIGQVISDEDKGVLILNGLVPAYDSFVTSIFALPPCHELVSKLTEDMDCLCDFSSSGFVVKDRKTVKVLGKGSRHGGPYALDPGDVNLASSSTALVASLKQGGTQER